MKKRLLLILLLVVVAGCSPDNIPKRGCVKSTEKNGSVWYDLFLGPCENFTEVVYINNTEVKYVDRSVVETEYVRIEKDCPEFRCPDCICPEEQTIAEPAIVEIDGGEVVETEDGYNVETGVKDENTEG